MSELPRAAVERLIRKAGAPRVSVTAVDALIEILEDIANDISVRANQLARHAGRKTVVDADIKMASRT
ncbi:MAG: NFYB/HAP3 family transcription factor subunit [Candidatus Diapherotrites archaeon]|nr:NFYB/HAP3 family transcription factor subunit [Candidatus Diapherotrites archaeon]